MDLLSSPILLAFLVIPVLAGIVPNATLTALASVIRSHATVSCGSSNDWTRMVTDEEYGHHSEYRHPAGQQRGTEEHRDVSVCQWRI